VYTYLLSNPRSAQGIQALAQFDLALICRVTDIVKEIVTA
jgi:hypothetical protein